MISVTPGVLTGEGKTTFKARTKDLTFLDGAPEGSALRFS
jgi:hypothetical protein